MGKILKLVSDSLDFSRKLPSKRTLEHEVVALGVKGGDRRVVAHLLDDHAQVVLHVLIGLAQKGVKGLADAVNRVRTQDEYGREDVAEPQLAVLGVVGLANEVLVLDVFGAALQHRDGLVEDDRHGDLGQLLADVLLQNRPHLALRARLVQVGQLVALFGSLFGNGELSEGGVLRDQFCREGVHRLRGLHCLRLLF